MPVKKHCSWNCGFYQQNKVAFWYGLYSPDVRGY